MLDGLAGPQNRFDRLNSFGPSRSRIGFVPDPPASQKIDAAIVSDPKQPRLQRTALVVLFQLPIRLDQGLLHDVFAVHD